MSVAELDAQVDAGFIRRGLEQANLDAVRVALYQQTHDNEIAALPVAAQLAPQQRDLLIARVVAWLQENGTRTAMPEPELPELRRLMEMATGQPMSDLEFTARRDVPGFRPFPFAVDWEGEKVTIPEGFSVAIIGSGVAGIAAAMQCRLLGIPYVVLERQQRPGGTWQINRYPGVRVDTPSISYEYSFEDSYDWDEHFCKGASVRSYLQHITERYGIESNTRFGCEVNNATFDEARDVWVLEMDTSDGPGIVEANVVITAVGLFANAKLPSFEGMEAFRGRIVHTARWPDEDVELRGKRVAIVGNGSTGVQILKNIAEVAEQVYVVQRTPQWISPREGYGQPITPELAWVIAHFPGYRNWWRYMATAALFDIHELQITDPEWQAQGGHVNPRNDELRKFLTGYIHEQTGGRKDLIEKVTPDYAPFSRRPVVDNGWYQALTRDNVELVACGITRLTENGFVAENGEELEVDVIVAATGFEVVKYLWPTKYVGHEGQDLHETWESRDGPRAYLGMMMPGFPNMFMLHGPNAQLVTGGTPMPSWYVVWASYAARCVMEMLRQGKSRVDVKPEAFERYNARLDAESAKLVQMTKEGGMDKNYFVNAEHGRIQVNAPWLSHDFHRMCTEVEWDDLQLT
ncbi:hypothetical protein MB02_10570 [Croceicoccus estronivorus]|uniref:flavin-containing monooxygenase n=1 Tax=Croceicoccus estronivorus TaxID=1172626 RepID=UPI00082C7DAB|nr:NAD(P)/FAD-dependent oxidoreductase [Croceicoccus estronivorus]OCC23605.1 hypothetical protein MB02_10570 [Croceicoccus estronivorus]